MEPSTSSKVLKIIKYIHKFRYTSHVQCIHETTITSEFKKSGSVYRAEALWRNLITPFNFGWKSRSFFIKQAGWIFRAAI